MPHSLLSLHIPLIPSNASSALSVLPHHIHVSQNNQIQPLYDDNDDNDVDKNYDNNSDDDDSDVTSMFDDNDNFNNDTTENI